MKKLLAITILSITGLALISGGVYSVMHKPEILTGVAIAIGISGICFIVVWALAEIIEGKEGLPKYENPPPPPEKQWKRSDISTKQVVESCAKFHEGKSSIAPWAILTESTGAPEKVVYAAMQRDLDNGYIECGISLRTAWPTEKGYKLLEGKYNVYVTSDLTEDRNKL